MGRSKHKPLLENLLITDIAAEGKAIARLEGMIVFVSGCVPGDVVDVQVIRKRKRYMEGFPVKYHTYSPNRSEPFCSHFGLCGGCKWQHLPYEDQLKSKQKWVADSLERIGKVEVSLIGAIIGSEKLIGYRNKLEFTFSHSRWLTAKEIQTGNSLPERRALGFHIPGKFDKVLDIDHCYLQPEPSNQIRNFVRQYALEHDLEFFDIIRKAGFLRNLTIRNTLSGDVMVIFSFFRDDHDDLEKLLIALAMQFPQITSLMYVINPKANDTLNDLDVIRFSGRDHLIESMEGLRFRISPKSFFQTNTSQAYRLYTITREFADLTGNEIVYDLYTGTGTIALFLAGNCKKAIGIENVAEAIEDANRNADLNGITNVSFFAGDIRELMNETFFIRNGYPDVLITDPPRTGMHEDVVKAILTARPRRIVYVSCNPATQARDIQLLSEHYRVLRCQPVDMFPFTHHVENVALLSLI
jgi:23S rRNA (uracil1939-C5)-methyltransferase